VKSNPVLENKYINIDDTDIAAVVRAVEARQLAGTAETVAEYERQLAKYFGVKHALAVSSGTAALHLLLYLLDVGEGDEVIVPPTAPIMSALPIIAVGAVPVFVDVEPDSFSYDLKDLEQKLTTFTKAIVTVPMWGYPIKMDRLRDIASTYHVPLIEDASHCHGSRGPEGLVGTVGDIGFFSTQERKLVATGEGGFILTNDDTYADRVREIRDFGKPVRDIPELREHLGQYGYLFGLNFRLAAMSAALGIAQVGKLPAKIRQRTANATFLKRELSTLDWVQEVTVGNGVTPNYYSMLLRVSHPKFSAHEVARQLYGQGIVSDTYRFGIKPLYDLPIFSAYATDCPNATQLLQNIITLPTHEGMTRDDMRRIVSALQDMAI
jgi:perosamine synthetase